MAATTQVRLLVWTFLCKMRVCNMCPHAPKTCHSAGLAVCSTSSCARAEAATVAAVSRQALGGHLGGISWHTEDLGAWGLRPAFASHRLAGGLTLAVTGFELQVSGSSVS